MKYTSAFLATALALSLVGCGSSSATSDTSASSAPASEPAVAVSGSVELNQVIYDDHDIRITLRSTEDKSQEDGTFHCTLSLENNASAEKYINLDGFALNFYECTPEDAEQSGWYPELALKLAPGEPTVLHLSFSANQLKKYDITSFNSIGFLTHITDDGDAYGSPALSDHVFVSLADTKDAPVTIETVGQYDGTLLFKVTNHTDSNVKIRYCIRVKDQNGNTMRVPNYYGGIDDLIEDTLNVATGAFEMLTAGTNIQNYYYVDDADEYIDTDYSGLELSADTEIVYVYPIASNGEEISDQVTLTYQGQSGNNSFSNFLIEWPEDVENVRGYATILVYENDQIVFAKEDELYADRAYAAESPDYYNILQCNTYPFNNPENRFEAIVNYAYNNDDE